MTDQEVTSPERPSRYTRSFGGLVGAMVVTVLLVGVFVGFRALFRDQPEVTPNVDYLSCVAYLEQADITVVHPRDLPKGWRANSIDFQRGTPPRWQLGAVTSDRRFVGLVQQQEDVEKLLPTYVGKGVVRGAQGTPANSLGVASWQTWSAASGDHAFSAELSSGPLTGETVLVYGSASVAQQQEFLRTLTTDPVGTDASAGDCDTDELQ